MADKAPPTMRMASSGKEREVSPRRTPFDSQPSRYAQLLEGLELVLEAGEGPANANNSPDDSPQVNEVKEVKEDVRAFVEQGSHLQHPTIKPLTVANERRSSQSSSIYHVRYKPCHDHRQS